MMEQEKMMEQKVSLKVEKPSGYFSKYELQEVFTVDETGRQIKQDSFSPTVMHLFEIVGFSVLNGASSIYRNLTRRPHTLMYGDELF